MRGLSDPSTLTDSQIRSRVHDASDDDLLALAEEDPPRDPRLVAVLTEEARARRAASPRMVAVLRALGARTD